MLSPSRLSPILIALGVVLILSGCVRRPPEPLRPSSPYPSRTEAPLVGGLVDRPIDGGTQALVVREGRDLGRCLAELNAARVRFSPCRIVKTPRPAA